MVQCHSLKAGDVLKCGDCGLELQVVKSCEDSCGDSCEDSGACSTDDFICCGKSMEVVESAPAEE